MSDAQAAAASERLPWLPNEQLTVERQSAWSPLLSWAGAALLLVAGASYWLGRSTDLVPFPPSALVGPVSETVALPDPAIEIRPHAAASEPQPPPAVEVTETARPIGPPAPSVEAQVSGPGKSAKRPSRQKSVRRPKRATSVAATPTAAPAAQSAVKPAIPSWPAPVTAVQLGRMIELGTYSSEAKLERGWQSRLRSYPQLQGLPKVIAPYKAKNDKVYYRLHVMTTARAQSDWLCRKIRRDWRRCTVLR